MSNGTPGPDAGPEEIQSDIEETRAKLAATVDELADRFDVGKQAKTAVKDVKENVSGAAHTAADKTAEVAGKVKGKVAGAASTAADRAENVAGAGKQRAKAAAEQVAGAAGQLRDTVVSGHDDEGGDGAPKLAAGRHSSLPIGRLTGSNYSVTDDGALLVEPIPLYRRPEVRIGLGVFVVGAAFVLIRGLR